MRNRCLGDRMFNGVEHAAMDGKSAIGDYLYCSALQGGAMASGRPIAGLAIGQRADSTVLDAAHADGAGKRDDQVLDALIFGRHGSPSIRHVASGGRWVAREGWHLADERSAGDASPTRKRSGAGHQGKYNDAIGILCPC